MEHAHGLPHDQAAALLPWYVNGTLAPGERGDVEAHLGSCRECRAELAACEALAAAVATADHEVPAPHPARLSALLARLDEPVADAAQPVAAGEASTRPERPVRRWWPALVVAQAAAIAALLGWSLHLASARPPAGEAVDGYRTLADDVAAPGAATSRLRVVFAPDTREEDLRRILLEVRAEVVAGPSPLGVYTLALPAVGGEPLELVVDHLRSRHEVRFATPVAEAPDRR